MYVLYDGVTKAEGSKPVAQKMQSRNMVDDGAMVTDWSRLTATVVEEILFIIF